MEFCHVGAFRFVVGVVISYRCVLLLLAVGF